MQTIYYVDMSDVTVDYERIPDLIAFFEKFSLEIHQTFTNCASS